MKILFDGIPLDKVSVSMTMNGAVIPILANFIVAGEEQGVIARSCPAPFRTISSKSSWSATPISIRPNPRCGSSRISSSTPRRDAEIQLDLDLRLSHAGGRREPGAGAGLHAGRWQRIRAHRDRAGHGCRRFRGAPVVLLRHRHELLHGGRQAARRPSAVARIMAEFEPKNPKSSMLRTHCQTSGVSLQEQDPYNNVVRTAYEAMSAVLGGTQSLHTNALDEAIALPTEFSARIARNTQLILQEETGVTNVVDPLAGSYYVESLTADWPKRLEADRGSRGMGGMTKAVASGMPKLRIEEAAAKRQAAIDRGDEVIVGVNKYRWTTKTRSTSWISTMRRCARRRSRGLNRCAAPRSGGL